MVNSRVSNLIIPGLGGPNRFCWQSLVCLENLTAAGMFIIVLLAPTQSRLFIPRLYRFLSSFPWTALCSPVILVLSSTPSVKLPVNRLCRSPAA